MKKIAVLLFILSLALPSMVQAAPRPAKAAHL